MASAETYRYYVFRNQSLLNRCIRTPVSSYTDTVLLRIMGRPSGTFLRGLVPHEAPSRVIRSRRKTLPMSVPLTSHSPSRTPSLMLCHYPMMWVSSPGKYTSCITLSFIKLFTTSLYQYSVFLFPLYVKTRSTRHTEGKGYDGKCITTHQRNQRQCNKFSERESKEQNHSV